MGKLVHSVVASLDGSGHERRFSGGMVHRRTARVATVTHRSAEGPNDSSRQGHQAFPSA